MEEYNELGGVIQYNLDEYNRIQKIYDITGVQTNIEYNNLDFINKISGTPAYNITYDYNQFVFLKAKIYCQIL